MREGFEGYSQTNTRIFNTSKLFQEIAVKSNCITRI